MGDLTKDFSRYEMACKCGCGADDISIDLVERLQSIRDIMGKPIHINSGVRCPHHNAKVGGSGESEHITGDAVDIQCEGSPLRYELLFLLMKKFNRIGIAKNFIHVGISKTKAQNVIWVY